MASASAGDIQSTEVLARTPPYLAYSLVLPYMKGMAFLSYWKSHGKSVDDIYASLPESSEQILHPEKYGTDHPVEVSVPDLAPLLGEFWREVAKGRIGEVGVSVLMLPLLADGASDVAALVSASGTDYVATGWGGDAYAAYENGVNGRVLAAWCTAWDTVEDATEFTLACHDLVYRRDPKARLVRSDGGLSVFRTASGETLLDRSGRSVRLVVGAFPNQVDDLVKALRPAAAAE